MKIRVNIMSGASGVKLDWVSGLSAPVPVFHTSLGADQEIGKASGYEVDGEDLWATVDIPEDCPPFGHAAAFLDRAQLKAVILTNLPRQAFIDLMAQLGSSTDPKVKGRALS